MVVFVFIWQEIVKSGYCNMTLNEYLRQGGMSAL